MKIDLPFRLARRVPGEIAVGYTCRSAVLPLRWILAQLGTAGATGHGGAPHRPMCGHSTLSGFSKALFMKRVITRSGPFAVALLLAFPASANGIGENGAWQFDTAADKVNKAFLEELRQKLNSGYFAAPVYNTNIDRQYNCSVTSTATGNSSSSNAVANSPSTSGNSSQSTGNANSGETNSGYGSGSSSTDADQSNSGAVGSHVSGSTSTSVRGNNWQALNTDQTNSGNQSASVEGSTACNYGALN